MILTKSDLKYYIEQDRLMNNEDEKERRHGIHLRVKQLLIPNLALKYLMFLRKSEYYFNRNQANHSIWNEVCAIYWRYKLRNLGIKLGYSIPINVVGPGLSLPHFGTIVVNGHARIGNNCRLHVGVNIGASGGNPKAPQIGNNVYIGPGAILFGDIKISDNVTIGANATVNRNCDRENVVLAGSPAMIVKENYPSWLEFNKKI